MTGYRGKILKKVLQIQISCFRKDDINIDINKDKKFNMPKTILTLIQYFYVFNKIKIN